MTAASDDPASLPNRLAALKEAVLLQRPVLRELITKHGTKRLIEYASLYTDVNLNPPIQRRQDELIGTFRDLVAERFGQTTASEASQQLAAHYFVSTTDHHGPIVNQSFCNANLLTTATYAEHNDPYLKYVIVLPCSNVSLNNITFPRGLIFNSVVDGKVQLQRLSFLPSNAHSAIVYNFRAYTEADLKKLHQVVQDKFKSRLISNDTSDKLHYLLESVYADPTIIGQANFSEQMIVANDRLWQLYFAPSGVAPARLLAIEQETITTELLLRYHLFEDTIISNMLFSEAYIPLLEHYFSGIMGAFNTKTKTGTYFFWGISTDKNYRVQLWKEGEKLVASDGSMVVDFTPQAVAIALRERKIIPSLLLVFSTLCFYYGLKCLGGFNQINYLTAMKNAYLKMNVDRQNYRSIEVCARAQTKEMNDGYLSAFAGAPDGILLPVTGLDLFLYGNAQTWPTIMDEVNNITIAESLEPAMPEFYRYVYTESERLPELAAITPEQVTEYTGLAKKLKPCVTLSA